MQSKDEAHSGRFSVLASKKHPYVLSYTIKNLDADKFFKISVWRKSKSNKGALVVSAKQLYKITSTPLISDKRGWKKLELEFFTPPSFKNDDVKIYCWSNTGDSVYFDDIEIFCTEKKYPNYKEQPLSIVLDTSAYDKIIKKRIDAFNAGVLQTADNDWVKGILFADGDMMKTKLRLKGDWLDHLAGNKWSFRIKIRKNKAWKRLRVFSVQNPVSRFGSSEWFVHQVYNSLGVLSTRYGFIPLSFNMKNLGLYAYEEHFEKQLPEYHQYREGPIFRFNENANWDVNRYSVEHKNKSVTTAFFDAAVIKPFGESRIMENPVLYREFILGRNLLFQYKHRLKSASDIFNVDAMAKFYALSDVLMTRHGTIWHNIRYYYNPILCKLEPIAYDCYTESGFFDWIGRPIYGMIKSDESGSHHDEYLMSRALFNDFDFLKLYDHYLRVFSDNNFLREITRKYGGQAAVYDSLIRIEYPNIKFDTAYLFSNANTIRRLLPDFDKYVHERINKKEVFKDRTAHINYDTVLEPYFLKNLAFAYVQEKRNDSVKLRVVNLFPEEVDLLGAGKKSDKMKERFGLNTKVKAFRGEKNNYTDYWVNEVPGYIFAYLKSADKTVPLTVYPWPQPDGRESPLQEIKRNSVFPDTVLVSHVSNDTVYINQGNILLNYKVIIPKGYFVVFSKATTIDMVNAASIISYSPVVMNGQKGNPVVISSSDHTANGFVVLQAKGRSNVDFVKFENLNTLSYKGWTLTGAVTFYESDATITNTIFVDNNCEDALNMIRSKFVLKNSRFERTFSDAFDSDFSNGLVDSVTFIDVGNDAIDFSGSRIDIANTTIHGAQDKGVSAGEDSHLTVSNTFISSANIGLASKDLSTLDVTGSKVDSCTYGAVLLQKKPEYGPSTMNLQKVIINNCKTKFLIEKGSKVIYNHKVIKGDKKNVAKIFY